MVGWVEVRTMRALIQRVSRAAVRVEGETVGVIDRGLCVLVGTLEGDDATDVAWMSRKLTTLRIFPDEAGKMNLSVVDVGGRILLVSQFTLAADLRKGTRPSFGRAMAPERAEALLETLKVALAETVSVETGRFRAHMEVELVNDGPVTIWLDSRAEGGA